MIQAKNQLTPRVYTKSILCVLFLMNMLSVVTASAKIGNSETKHKPPTELEKEALVKDLKQKIATKQSVSYSKNCLFVENKGQVKDQYQQPRHDIQYSIAAANGLNVFVGNGAIHYQFNKTNSDPSKKMQPTDTNGVMYSMYRMDVELVGANKNAVLIPEQQQTYYEYHHTTGNADVKANAYNRIMYKEVYPNIDWVLYISSAKENKGTLKHEFVVHKGGRASDIKIKYSGATSLQINTEGALTAATPMGTVTEQTPYTYQQDGQQITSSYKLNGNVLSYETGTYEGDLTIDPTVAWATYYGGGGTEGGYSVATDNMGNVLLAGVTASNSNIATTGTHASTNIGYQDAFLVKFNSAGVRQWGTYYGGGYDDRAQSIVVDTSGNIWMTGTTNSATGSGIATAGAHDTTFGGYIDAFLVKFNSVGIRQWSTYYGGTRNEYGNSVATDNYGNVWMGGTTQSYIGSGIASPGAYDTTLNSGIIENVSPDAFLVKFNSMGVRQWGTYFGGNSGDDCTSLAIDDSGNTYLTGYTGSTESIATMISYGGDNDAYIAKFDNNGNRIWGTYFGGSSWEYGKSICIDGDRNIYLTGITNSPSGSGVGTAGSHSTTFGGANDAFLAKFNNSGVRLWSTYYGGSAFDYGESVATDNNGNVWITGETGSTSNIATICAHDNSLNGGQDAYVAKFNAAGILLSGTYFGGNDWEYGFAITTDGSGNAYTTGYTSSATNIATSGSHDETYGDGGDAFLVKFTADTLPAAIMGITTICVGGTTALSNATTCGNWSSSNTPVATIGATTGVVSGLVAGTTIITYTTAGGIATVEVAVKTLPTVGVVPETTVFCEGRTAKLTGTGAISYSWTGGVTNGVPFVPPVGITTYTVTGYTGLCSNTATITLTVNPAPTVGITGGGVSICEGLTLILSGTGASTYSWTGGVSDGISHKLPVGTHSFTVTGTDVNGCKNTATTTVTVLPRYLFTSSAGPNGTISPLGTVNVCSGETRVYTIVPNAGFHIADVTVNGSSVGAVSSYTLTATSPQNIHATFLTNCTTPPAITGTFTLCSGSSTTLSHVYTGGTWSSSDPEVATIGATTALLTGVRAGTVVISYFPCPDFYTTTTVTIHPSPSAITGGSIVCVGNTLALANEESGGLWSSSNPAAATVDTATGIVSGLNTGTTTITYTLPGGCSSSITIIVNPSPAAITGLSTALCEGSTATLSTTDVSGTWSSAVPAVATVSVAGLVTGVSAGTAIISYTNSSCSSTKIVTVNPLPSAITGPASACPGGTIPNTATPAGGTWSLPTFIAFVDPSTGLVYTAASGSAVLSYTLPTGCRSTRTIVVDYEPPSITGITSTFVGGTTTLNNGYGVGTWSSSNPSVAAITSTLFSTATVTGISIGTAIISFTVGSCSRVTVVTVVAPLPSITGTPIVCAGQTNATLGHATAGGIWSSNNTSIATIHPTTGLLTGITTGTTHITYTTSPGIFTTIIATVNTTMATNFGETQICPGTTTTLTNAITGGIWSSSNTAVATVNSATGVVTGIVPGTTTINYYRIGCSANTLVSVNPMPVAGTLSGASVICVGASATLLTKSGAVGVWSSSNAEIANVSTTGIVTGISPGTVTISFTVTNFCGSATATREITVLSIPAAGTITGSAAVCVGTTTALTATVSGGTWSSGYAATATVSTTGMVTGIGAGSATISYRMTNYCGTTYATKIITVSPIPNAGTIGGASSVCVGATTTLPFISMVGVWTSSNPSVATINASRVVTGIATGTVTISHAVTNGCGTAVATKILTVNPLPAAGSLSGAAVICAGTTTSIAPSISGGTWISSNGTKATVNAAGLVTGISAGSAVISYFISNSCGLASTTHPITISPAISVGAIGGPSVVCAGTTVTLTNTTLGGTWTSSNTSAATISTSGIVTGVGTGTTTISYVATNSCGTSATSKTITVNPQPEAGTISGATAMCTGTTATLSTTATGGTWISGGPSAASVSSAGLVTAISAGDVPITYRVINSCGTANAIHSISINSSPTVGVISGPSVVCAGNSIALTNTTSGGTWSSTSTSVATIGSTGTVSSLTDGVTTISYNITNGCGTVSATKVVTVIPLPIAGTITGDATVCRTTSTTLSSSLPGGTWSSSYAAGASVSTTGVVTGLANGTFTISYRMTNSCGNVYATHPISVISAPSLSIISGTATVCVGATNTLTNITTGGTWTSANTAVATINATTGAVTGVTSGTAIISYSYTNTCGSATVTRVVTVTPLPVAGTISGTTTLPAGTTTTLSSSVPGGTWLSANGGIASVNASTGVVTGVAAGLATISYISSNSCGSVSTTIAVTVATPSTPITGLLVVCENATTTLANATTGGTWSSANTSIATISSAGVLTGIAVGTTHITYSYSVGGFTTSVITVNALPATYTGSGVVCSGSQLNLGSILPSCLWSSSNTARALVTYTGGLVTGGISLGTVTITYTNTALCRRVTQLTINGAVASITGVSNPCTGSSITLSSATPGGTWSSSDITKASIHLTTGVFTALSIGSVTVTYRTAANCYKTATTTIGTPPAIAGNANVCLGLSSYLTSSGGVWSSGNTAVASVAGNGFVTGVSLGTAVISYRSTANAGCFVTRTVTVHALPSVIVAAPALCPGQTTTLTSSPAGGTWTSSYPAKVSVHPVTGLITGLVIDHAIISVANVTYTLPNTCSRSTIVTVNPIPPPIGGINSVCVGSSVTLSNSTAGNTWSSANTIIATVSTGGVVLGKEAGITSISYTNSYGCANTVQVSVHAMPGANTGSATLCVPSGTTTLSNPAGAGTWTSSNNSMATVNFNTGVVTGINIGTARITYSKAAGCISVTQVTVTACAARPGMSAETDDDKNSWFTVSPNPTTGAINITTAAAGSLAIFSIDGMQVLHTYTQAGTAAITLPATLSTGIYMLRYTGNDGNTKTIRLVYTP